MRQRLSWFVAGILAAMLGTAASAQLAPVNDNGFTYMAGPVVAPNGGTTASPARGGSLNVWLQNTASVNPHFVLPAGDMLYRVCSGRMLFTYNDSGTFRYYWLDLASGSGTWSHSTSNPC